MASGKKPFARRDVLRSCPQSGDRAAAARCPRALKPRALHAEFPHPFCGSGPADRGGDQAVRFYRSRPVRRGQHHLGSLSKNDNTRLRGKALLKTADPSTAAPCA